MASMRRVARRRRSRPVVLTWAVLVAVACSSPAERAERHARLAQEYFARGDHAEAVIEARNVLKIRGEDPAAERVLGLSLARLEKWANARYYLEATRDRDPSDLAVRAALGAAYAEEGRLRAAWDELLVVAASEGDRRTLALLARVARTRDDLETVLSLLAGAGDLRSADDLLLLGIVHARLGDLASADAALRSAIDAAPDAAEPHFALGVLRLDEDDVAEARTALESAVALDSSDGAAGVRLAEVELRDGDRAAARARLGAIVERSPDAIDAWRLLAAIHMDDGDDRRAAAALEIVLERSPRDAGAWFLSGQLALRHGRHDEAVVAFRKALDVRAGFAPALAGLGRAQLSAGQLAQARSSLERAVEARSASALIDLADVHLRTGGDADDAVDLLLRSLDTRPDHVRGLMLLGQAHLQAGRAVDAAAAHRRWIELAPNEARAHFLLGIDLRALGDVEGAAQAFAVASELAPDKVDALGQLAEVLTELGRTDEAVMLVAEQAHAHVASVGHQVLLGSLCRRLRRWDCAEEGYGRAAELAPDPWRARLALADVRARRGKLNAAIEQLAEMVRERPDDAAPALLLGQLQDASGDRDGARRTYRTLVSRHPSHAVALNNLAVSSMRAGQITEAHQLAERARRLAPDDPHVADTLGWILVQLGEVGRAMELLEWSASELTESAAVHYHLGVVYARVGGRDEEARALLRRALDLDPELDGAAEVARELAALE